MAEAGKVRELVAYTTYAKMLGHEKNPKDDATKPNTQSSPAPAKAVTEHCGVCDEAFSMEHVVRSHLPWYAGLSVPLLPAQSDPRVTVLSMKLYRGVSPSTSDVNTPNAVLAIIGSLLHGMLKFMTKALKLKSLAHLLKYVLDRKLWPPADDILDVHGVVLRNIVIPAHQLYSSKKHLATCSPPNCVSGILHWHTLANIVRMMLQKDQAELLRQETYVWSKRQPSLPSLLGPVKQPLLSAHAPQKRDIVEFRLALAEADFPKICELLAQHPRLVTVRLPSAIVQGLVFDKSTPLMKKHQLASMLMLLGADIDAQDESGFTALHHAVNENKVQVIIILLLWEANVKVKSHSGTTAYDLAKSMGYTDICTILDAAEKGEYYRIAAVSSDYVKDISADISGDKPRFVLPTITVPVKSPGNSKEIVTQTMSKDGKQMCAKCPEVEFSMTHVIDSHLPWYACLMGRILDTSPRSTVWAKRICKCVYPINNAQSIPHCVRVVIGGLLAGMLQYIANSLDLESLDELLRYVNCYKLWTKSADSKRSTLQFEVSLAAYVAYTGTQPCKEFPLAIADLLHWDTLWNIITQMSKDDRAELITYESFQWNKNEPTLPSPSGPVLQPVLQEDFPSTGVMQDFLLALEKGLVTKVTSFLDKHPNIVYCSIGPTVLTQALVFNRNSNMDIKHRLACMLLLSGASVDAADLKGFTALHHAVKENRVQVVNVLLTWDADIHVKAADGKSPCDIASLEGLTQISSMFDKVKKGQFLNVSKPKADDEKSGKKTATETREKSPGLITRKSPCSLCENKSYNWTHAVRYHLPWYAGLDIRVCQTVYDPRRTRLCLMMMRDFYLQGTGKQSVCVPHEYLVVIGKLLYDMLVFMAKAVKVKNQEGLLKYVRDRNLWSVPKGHAKLIFEKVAVPGYNLHAENITVELSSDPPNCPAALLYWETLYKIVLEMPRHHQEELVTLESYGWPSVTKLLPPSTRKDLAKIPQAVQTTFKNTLAGSKTAETDICKQLNQYPALVYWKDKELGTGAITQALVFGQRKHSQQIGTHSSASR